MRSVICLIAGLLILVALQPGPKRGPGQVLSLIYHANGVHETAGNRLMEELTDDVMSWLPDAFPAGAHEYPTFWSSWSTVQAVRRAMASRGVRPDPSFRDTAVFHLRCSDVGRYNESALKAFATAAGQFASRRNVSYVRISWCGDHHGGGAHFTPEGHCADMAELVAASLKNATALTPKVECWPIAKTWDRFLGARVLISTTGSFGFAVGMARQDSFVFPHPACEKCVPWYNVGFPLVLDR